MSRTYVLFLQPATFKSVSLQNEKRSDIRRVNSLSIIIVAENQLLMEILKMHNQQGFESDNDSCSIDKKDKHPPLKRVWFIIFVVLIAIDTIVFLLLRTALRYCRWKNHYYCTDIN